MKTRTKAFLWFLLIAIIISAGILLPQLKYFSPSGGAQFLFDTLTKNQPKTQKGEIPEHYLKNLKIEDIDNKTKITATYLFPSTAYNTTLVDVKVNGSLAILYVRINRSNAGLDVLTYKNITVFVDKNVSTAMVLTEV